VVKRPALDPFQPLGSKAHEFVLAGRVGIAIFVEEGNGIVTA
jgi:hypothetical protein